MERLKNNNFKYYKEHAILDGGHIEPLRQFNLVCEFLETHLPVE